MHRRAVQQISAALEMRARPFIKQKIRNAINDAAINRSNKDEYSSTESNAKYNFFGRETQLGENLTRSRGEAKYRNAGIVIGTANAATRLAAYRTSGHVRRRLSKRTKNPYEPMSSA